MIWDKFKAQVSDAYNWLMSNFRSQGHHKVHFSSKDEIKTYSPQFPPNSIKPNKTHFSHSAHFKPMGKISKIGASSPAEIANLVNQNHSEKLKHAGEAARHGMADKLWAMDINSPAFYQQLGPNTQAAIIQAQQYDANPTASNSIQDINNIRENILQALEMDKMPSRPFPRP